MVRSLILTWAYFTLLALNLIITNGIIDLNCLDAGTQCFTLYYYVENEQVQGNLFDATSESKYIRRDGVSDFILESSKKQYCNLLLLFTF